MNMRERIQSLCSIDGVSGREADVRRFILQNLPDDVETETDALGNLYVHKKGARRPANKVSVLAHMDEVGLIVTSAAEDGYLTFDEIGGVDPAVLIGRTVRLECGQTGIIALKHIHLCSKEEAGTIPEMKDLRIDIGAADREAAEKMVSPGSYAVFQSDYVEFGTSFVKMKALDDRVGCALMLELLDRPLLYDTEFIFTVQEEVGARGAMAAAVHADPDIALILETTTAGDICGVTGEQRTCCLGKGPVVSYMDRGTVYDHALYTLAVNTAEEHGIPVQTKTRIAGGNDASSVQRAGNGARVAAVSVPTRYLHSPVDVMNYDDAEASLRLLDCLLPKLSEAER